IGAGPAEFVARPTVTWMPRLAARWSGRSARCDRPGTGREVLVLKGYDEVAVFLGWDVGKQGHHAVAQDRSGKKLLDRALPNDEAKLRELYGRMKVHGPVLLVVDQPATIGALPVAVALDEGITVAYLPGLAMRRIARPGRYATVMPSSRATATGSAPMVAGWSTTSSTGPWTFIRPYSSRSLASSLGSARSSSFLPDRSCATAWCPCLPTSNPRNTATSSYPLSTSTSRPVPGLSQRADLPDQRAASLGIHVTVGLATNSAGPAPISDHPPPTGTSDNTSQIINDREEESYRSR